tara:strand:- start:808 stop:999 length:192 start_codon:yes stop_codon:yes gene_type:complete
MIIIPNTWKSGYQVACAEYLAGDVYDLKAAIDSFKYDPADNEFQMGYLCGLVNTRNNVEASHD